MELQAALRDGAFSMLQVKLDNASRLRRARGDVELALGARRGHSTAQQAHPRRRFGRNLRPKHIPKTAKPLVLALEPAG